MSVTTITTTIPIDDEMIDTQELARWLSVSERTVRNLRAYGKGPKSVKVGASIRFRRADVEAWIAAGGDRE